MADESQSSSGAGSQGWGEHQPSLEEKFWEIEVDYPNDQTYPTKGSTARIYSYLRLGTAEDFDDSRTARGHDLAALVTDFVDDSRNRGSGDAERVPLTTTERASETAKLQTKGGWRDHSDGNRVSTTRGDKVEVIRGNYRLLVLGRQDDPENGAMVDASGGLIQDGDIAPGSVTEIRWVQNPYGGTWRVIEEATKGDTVTRYHGDVDEIYYGKKITATVGSETPTAKPPKGTTPPRASADGAETFGREGWADSGIDAVVRSNPTIVERTWAEKIESYTGSATTRVPSIDEQTWAAKIAEIVDCSGNISSDTRAGSVTEKTKVTGKLDVTTTAGDISDVTSCSGVVTNHTYAPQIAELVTAANVSSLAIVLATENVSIGAVAEVFLGAKASLIMGTEMDITIGPKLEIVSSDAKEMKLSEVKTALSAKITALKVELGI